MKSLLPASFGKPRLSGACLGSVPTNQPRALNSPSSPSLTMTRDVRSFAAAACAVEATPQPARDAGASPKSPRSRSTPTRKAEIAKQGPALDQLAQPVSILPGVGAKYKQLMQAHEIKTVSDLMHMHIKKHGKQMEVTQRYLKETVGINNSGCLRGITSYLAQKQQELEEEAQKGRGDAVPSWLQPKVTLSVEGNISAGKSTFLKILENKGLFESKLQVVPEPVEKWQNVGVGKDKVNLLMEFYKAPERFAYTFQNFVFLTRMIQERESYTAAAMCRLLERSVFSDKMVFVRSVHAARYMSDTELEIYNSWFDPVLSTLPTLVPNGFIYLRATPETCLKRLKRRGRSEETSVQLDYLSDLHSKHEDWLYDGGEAVAAGGPDNQYLWLEPTGQVLKNSRHVPAQSSVGSVLRPGRFSIKRFDRSTDGLDPSVYGQQGLLAARLPKVPEALDNAIRFLDTSRGEHMHPILNTVPALVLDCEADVDVERDLDYQTHVADKVSKYCDYVRDYMKARGSAQMLQQHMDLNTLGATGSESNGYHLQVNGATLYLDPKMPLMAFGSEQGQRLASAQATSELALPGSLPSAAGLAERRRTRSSDASHPKGHAPLTGGKVLHATHS